jgi:hypothetical protein
MAHFLYVDADLTVKEAKPKALSSFLNNIDDTVYNDDIDDENDDD